MSFLTGILDTVAGAPVKAAAKVGLSVVSSWIVDGAEAMLHEVVTVISAVTTPSLSVSWFSVSYWRISGLAVLLTLPFLFAAAVQAVLRTDLGVLVRAALFDLPIAMIAVTVAAPLITLLLAATDEMCSLVTGGGPVGGGFLAVTSTDLSHAGGGFMLIVIAIVIMLAGMVLMVELIIRAAAIYVVVLFLPLGFAAMVWPARRVWIKRMLELLISLILSKFVMVATLSLAVSGLASLSANPSSLTTAFMAMALMLLSALSPWALLRLLPFTELAASHGPALRDEISPGIDRGQKDGARALDVGAGLFVDPLMAGLDGLRRFASGGSSDGRGGTMSDGMAVLGGPGAQRELPSSGGYPDGDDPSGGTQPGGQPGGAQGGGGANIAPAVDAGGPSGFSGGLPAPGGPQPPTGFAASSGSGAAPPPAGDGTGLGRGGDASPPPDGSGPLAPFPTGERPGGPPNLSSDNGPEQPSIEDAHPVLRAENEALQFNARSDGRGFLVPQEDPASPDHGDEGTDR